MAPPHSSPPAATQPRRSSSWYRTAEWRARRAAQLAAEPWCRFHAQRGEKVRARIVDHIDPHRGDRMKFFHGRLQSLCDHCHSSVKQSIEVGRRAGCNEDGLPVDPTHPWAGGDG